MKLKELKEKAVKTLSDARAILDKADKEQRGLNTDEKVKYENFNSEFDTLQEQIRQIEASNALKDELREKEAFMDEIVSKELPKSKNSAIKDDEYTKTFFDYVRGDNSALYKLKRDLNEGSGPNGGYTVPKTFQARVLEKLNNEMFLRQLCTVTQTTSTNVIPVGGVVPEFDWIEEKGVYNEKDLTFSQIEINAYKIGGIIKISEELLEDSAINIESYILNKMVEGLKHTQELAFVKGDGNKKPKGLATYDVGLTTASANAITDIELIDFFYSLDKNYRDDAVWVVSDEFEKALRKLKDTTGNYLWQPALTAGAQATLLGKPIYVSGYMDGLESGKVPAVFGNLRYYNIADRGSMSLQRLNELYAGNGQVGFRARARVDGVLTINDAIKCLKCA